MPRIDEENLLQGKYPDRNFFDIPQGDKKIKTVDKAIFKKRSDVIGSHQTDKEKQKKTINGKTDITQAEAPGDAQIIVETINKLHGNQKDILFLIASLCIKNETLSTGKLNMELFTSATGATVNTIRSSIRRLNKRKLIEKEAWCPGRGGYVSFNISEDAKKAVIETRKPNEASEGMFLSSTPPGYDSEEFADEKRVKNHNMPNEWLDIDYSPLESIGFSLGHLLQIHREFVKNPDKELPASVIQDSINALAFDLKHNNAANNFKNSPAVVLTAVLKKGWPYVSTTPEKFKTPRQEAMQAYTRMRAIQQETKLKIQQELKDVEFTDWQSSLSEEDLLALCPESDISKDLPKNLQRTRRRKMALELAKDYFDAEIWPEKLEEINRNINKQLDQQEKIKGVQDITNTKDSVRS